MDISITKQATLQAFSTIDGALESQPTGLSRLLLAYSPSPIKKILENGRLRLAHLDIEKKNSKILSEEFKTQRIHY